MSRPRLSDRAWNALWCALGLPAVGLLIWAYIWLVDLKSANQ